MTSQKTAAKETTFDPEVQLFYSILILYKFRGHNPGIACLFQIHEIVQQ